jgi:15-cis-phytoene synthase
VMDRRAPNVLARACDLGIAMQLTNIARDVGEDARAGRLYLPQQWLREAGIDPDAWLAAPRFSPQLALLVQRLLDAADTLYARAAAGIAELPPACRPGMHAARLLYAEIGRALERADLDSVSQRAVVPPRRKLAVLASGLLMPAIRHGRSAPPLEAARFLVEAVTPLPAHPPRSVEDRLVWVLDLFTRLEQRDAMLRARP